MTEPQVRSATLEDAQLICDLINAVDLVDIGTADFTVAETVEDLSEPGMDLTRDTWLAFVDGRLVAYGVWWNDHHDENMGIDHYVLRDYVPVGEHLIDLMTERCAQAAAANGVTEAVVQLGLTPNSALAQGPLTRRGWRTVRRFNQMVRPVSVEADPVPATPPGVALRNPSGEADLRIVHRLRDESFAEHFGHQPETWEQWRLRLVDSGQLDPSLTWIASVEGTDMGVLIARNNRESMGWVHVLGVLKEARGRGIGKFLLRTAFAEFARLGRHTVGLGVDTENATGALGLYTGLGMTRQFAADTWETRIPAAEAAKARLTDAAVS
jgi:GNAT superfamily N-acetyltransferase